MGKRTLGYSFSGEFDLEEFTITEIKKEETKVYSLMEFLREFNGKNLSITLKEDSEPPTMEE